VSYQVKYGPFEGARYEKIDNGLLDKAFRDMFPDRASDVTAKL
jgi:hypothetical protein